MGSCEDAWGCSCWCRMHVFMLSLCSILIIESFMRVYLVRYISWMTFRDIWNLKTDIHDHIRVYNCARACLPTQAKIEPSKSTEAPFSQNHEGKLPTWWVCHLPRQHRGTAKNDSKRVYNLLCVHATKSYLNNIIGYGFGGCQPPKVSSDCGNACPHHASKSGASFRNRNMVSCVSSLPILSNKE
jgi:hypothetical protein